MPPPSREALARGQEAVQFYFEALCDLMAYPESVRQLSQHGTYPRSEVITHLCVWGLRLWLEWPRLRDALVPVTDALARAHAVTDRVAVGEVVGPSLTECLVEIADRLIKVPFGRLEFLGVGRVLAVVRNQECFRSLQKAADAPTLCDQLPYVLSPAANGVRPQADAAETFGPEWALLWANLVDDPNFTAAVGAFCSNQTVFLTVEDALAFDPKEVGPQLAREFAHAGKECTSISPVPNADFGGVVPGVVAPAEPPSGAPAHLTAEDLELFFAGSTARRAKEARLGSLHYCDNDAAGLADVLTKRGYRVTLMTRPEYKVKDRDDLLPTADNVRANLTALLRNRRPVDTVLLAFAGHGEQLKKDGKMYFCPAKCDLNDPKTLISLDEVYAALKDNSAGGKVLIVDACRNDPPRGPGRGQREAGERDPAGIARPAGRHGGAVQLLQGRDGL